MTDDTPKSRFISGTPVDSLVACIGALEVLRDAVLGTIENPAPNDGGVATILDSVIDALRFEVNRIESDCRQMDAGGKEAA